MLPKALFITGASSTGKSTLVRLLSNKLGLLRIPGDTTRSPREEEVEGEDFIYISKIKFFLNFLLRKYIDPSFKVTWYNGNYYGSPVGWVKFKDGTKNVIFTPTSTITAMRLKELLPKGHYLWVHLVADPQKREVRLEERGASKNEIMTRLNKGDSQGLCLDADINLDTSQIDLLASIRIIEEAWLGA